MDIYSASSHQTNETKLRKKLEVGPEGSTCKEEIVNGEKVAEGSNCFVMGFDKPSGKFEGILKSGKERL